MLKITVPDGRVIAFERVAVEDSPRLVWVSCLGHKQTQVNNPMTSRVARIIPKRWLRVSSFASPIAIVVMAWCRSLALVIKLKSIVFGSLHSELHQARFPNFTSFIRPEQWPQFSPMLLNIDKLGVAVIRRVKKSLLSCGQSAKCFVRHNESLSFCLVAFSRGNDRLNVTTLANSVC